MANYTRVVELSTTEYTLVTTKAQFLVQNPTKNQYVQFIANDSKPSDSDEGVYLDAFNGITRNFDGDLWAKARRSGTSLIVMESATDWDA